MYFTSDVREAIFSATTSEGKYTNRIGLNVDSSSSFSHLLLCASSSPLLQPNVDCIETHFNGSVHPHKFAIASNSCSLFCVIQRETKVNHISTNFSLGVSFPLKCRGTSFTRERERRRKRERERWRGREKREAGVSAPEIEQFRVKIHEIKTPPVLVCSHLFCIRSSKNEAAQRKNRKTTTTTFTTTT